MEKFQTRTIRPGTRLSLRCSATGNPRPGFRWLLDGQPLANLYYSQQMSMDGTVVSRLVIDRTLVEQGGRYTCQAYNKAGSAYHTSTMNIFGIPTVRTMHNVTMVAGSDLRINCYVYGYPVTRIVWLKGILLWYSFSMQNVFQFITGL